MLFLVAYHSKGIPVWSGDLVNKGSFLAQVKLFTFFDGSELPFEMLVLVFASNMSRKPAPSS